MKLNQELYTENTMLVCFDIKFIRQDQKQRKNGEAMTSKNLPWPVVAAQSQRVARLINVSQCIG